VENFDCLPELADMGMATDVASCKAFLQYDYINDPDVEAPFYCNAEITFASGDFQSGTCDELLGLATDNDGTGSPTDPGTCDLIDINEEDCLFMFPHVPEMSACMINYAQLDSCTMEVQDKFNQCFALIEYNG